MRRDVKGLYQMAREGKIALTGYSHPYELPDKAELTINAGVVPVDQSVDFILGYLTREGYLDEQASAAALAQHPDIVTAGVVDPAARLCVNLAKPALVIGFGPFGSGLATLRDTMTQVGLKVASISQAEMGAVEGVDSVPSSNDVDFDAAYATGTPATSQLSSADTVEAAWR